MNAPVAFRATILLSGRTATGIRVPAIEEARTAETRRRRIAQAIESRRDGTA